MTFVVAADNSNTPKRADYVCDGTDDQVQIQTAIDAAPGDIVLLEGMYNTKATIVVKRNRHLVLSQGAIINAQSNINVVQLKPESSISGGKINVSGITFSNSAIYLDGADWDALGIQDHRSTIIENIFLESSRASSPVVGRGTGIELDAIASNKSIYYVSVSRVRISKFEYGIHLRSSGGKTLETEDNEGGENRGWINGNYFSNIWLIWCDYFFYLDRYINKSWGLMSGNRFQDIYIQAGINSKRVMISNAYYTVTNAHISDWHVSNNKKPLAAISELSGARDNYYKLEGLREDYAPDEGLGKGSFYTNTRRETLMSQLQEGLRLQGSIILLPMADGSGNVITSLLPHYPHNFRLYGTPTWGSSATGAGKVNFNGTTKQYARSCREYPFGHYDKTFILAVSPNFDYNDGSHHTFMYMGRNIHEGLSIYKHSDNTLRFRVWNSDDVQVTTTIQFSKGDNLIIIANYDKDGDCKLFVNGTLKGSEKSPAKMTRNSSTIYLASDNNVPVPANYAGGDYFFFELLNRSVTDIEEVSKITSMISSAWGLSVGSSN